MANSHDIVAHNWAHQTGRKSKGFNMFYEGETIYSYGHHFPIAKFVTAPNGERVVLINTDDYSKSTSKHKTIVRRALGYERNDELYVPMLGRGNSRDWIKNLDTKSEKLADKWKRARSHKDGYAWRLASTIETINRIIDLWQMAEPKRTMPEDIAAFAASFEERRKAEQVEKDKKDREAIRRWLDGEDVQPPHTRVPYVRVKSRRCGPEINEHGDFAGMITTVETSWGVKVPLADAYRLYRMAGLVRIVGKAWEPKRRHEIGGWRILGIKPDGTLTVGCHVLPYKVQQEAARLAGMDVPTLHTIEEAA